MHGLHETSAGAAACLMLALIMGLAVSASAQSQRGDGLPPPPRFDEATAERGKAAFFAQCGFCHGANARGGDGGPDLVRSVLVIDDEGGKQLGDFAKIGRADKGMPSFPGLTSQQISDIATFLHREIYQASNRRTYEILNILVGDAKAGEAFFNGAGKCNACHSTSGDLKGVSGKYDVLALQGQIVMPRRGNPAGGGGGASDTGPLTTVTVAFPSGPPTSGVLLRVTDFDVTLRDSSGAVHSFTRNGEIPKVEVNDPLQAHVDLLLKYKDADIHNLTAYLVTLK
jgi:cytochrome c oxidase cbb3-type subunit III